MRIRIGLAQCDVTLGDVDANLDLHRDWIDRARRAEVDLLVFPELSLSGYLLQDMVPEVSLSLDDPRLCDLARAGGDMSLLVGAVEESTSHSQYIAGLYLEDGRVHHVHRKVYLAAYGVFDEARYLGRGSRIEAFDTRFGRIGTVVCEDAWHPSLVSTLLLDGADLLVVQVASPVRDLTQAELPANAQTWLDTLRTYARLYGVWIAFCNRVGSEDGLVYWGHSCVFSPDGEIAASGATFEEELVTAEIHGEALRRARLANPILREERIDLTVRELQRIRGVLAPNGEDRRGE
jgi:predicted amidohydrolase